MAAVTIAERLRRVANFLDSKTPFLEPIKIPTKSIVLPRTIIPFEERWKTSNVPLIKREEFVRQELLELFNSYSYHKEQFYSDRIVGEANIQGGSLAPEIRNPLLDLFREKNEGFGYEGPCFVLSFSRFPSHLHDADVNLELRVRYQDRGPQSGIGVAVSVYSGFRVRAISSGESQSHPSLARLETHIQAVGDFAVAKDLIKFADNIVHPPIEHATPSYLGT